jgi:HTH-type transcriptional regulator, sugar sensing transcriptional regulator
MEHERYFELLKIGLTEGEAKVYLALIGLGSSTVGPIVKKSRVAYSNVYDVLNRLMEKGVVSYVMKSKTKYFQAVSPKNLFEYLNKKEEEIVLQKKELEHAIPLLEKLQEFKPKQKAEIFLGIKGMRAAYEKLFEDGDAHTEDLFFYIHEKDYANESDLFYSGLKHLFQKYKFRGIGNESFRDSSFVDYTKDLKTMRLRFVDIPIPGNIEVCGDKVLVVSWEGEKTAFLIHSLAVAKYFRQYFESVWKIAKE